MFVMTETERSHLDQLRYMVERPWSDEDVVSELRLEAEWLRSDEYRPSHCGCPSPDDCDQPTADELDEAADALECEMYNDEWV